MVTRRGRFVVADERKGTAEGIGAGEELLRKPCVHHDDFPARAPVFTGQLSASDRAHAQHIEIPRPDGHGLHPWKTLALHRRMTVQRHTPVGAADERTGIGDRHRCGGVCSQSLLETPDKSCPQIWRREFFLRQKKIHGQQTRCLDEAAHSYFRHQGAASSTRLP
jgi:hypothetical protein